MKKALKIGGLLLGGLVGVLVVALVTLRLTDSPWGAWIPALEPEYLDPTGEQFAANNRIASPGLWLRGEVVRTPVKDWSWVHQVNDPVRGNTIMIETRTRYFIPHSVTIGVVGRGDKLYIHSHQDPVRMKKKFPYDKGWTANVARDPRVRLKMDGKIYEATVALMTDRAEVAGIMGRDPVTVEKGPDGKERVKEVMHYWRVFQRNVPDYGSGLDGGEGRAPLS